MGREDDKIIPHPNACFLNTDLPDRRGWIGQQIPCEVKNCRAKLIYTKNRRAEGWNLKGRCWNRQNDERRF